MSLILINSEKRLNNFIVQSGRSNFLQSWEWGEFQMGLGRKIWRIGTVRKRKLIASALIIKKTLPLGRCYLYCPRGPAMNFQFPRLRQRRTSGQAISPPTPKADEQAGNFQKVWNAFLSKIREIGREEKAVFFRFDFPDARLPIKPSGDFVRAPIDVQPRHTLIVNLQKDQNDLLQEMKPKTRYNIRLAKRKGVRVRQGLKPRDLNKFLELIETTAKRDKFRAHPADYYRRMVEVLGKGGLLRIFSADYQGKTIAANLILFFGRSATYLHGGSDNQHRNVMAPHLLQWEQILEAKRRGCLEYDFWGITAPAAQFPKWEGITRFKKGFGGEEVGYAGTYDLVLNPLWCRMYKIFHKKHR